MFCTVIVLHFPAYSNQTRHPKTYGQNGHFAQIHRYFIFFIYTFVPERKKLQAVSTTACHGISGQIQKLQTGGDYDRSHKRHADQSHKKAADNFPHTSVALASCFCYNGNNLINNRVLTP